MKPVDEHKIKIALVIGALTQGGSERQLLGILHHLDRNQFQPHLFTFYSHGELSACVPKDVIQYCDQTDNRLNTSSRYLAQIPGAIQRRLAKSLRRYCVEHKIDLVYDRTYHVSLVTGAACHPINIPYINTIVSDPYSDFFPTAGPFGWLKYFRLRSIYERANRVLCVSEGLCDSAAKFYQLPRDRFEVCYNFIDKQRLNEIEQAAEDRLQISGIDDFPLGTPHRRLNIVAVGRLHPQKGVSILVQAMELVVKRNRLNAYLTIVGDGPDRQMLENLSLSNGLSARIRFVGTVPDPTRYMAEADIYCLPSLGEGMPGSLIEALLVGVPAIASDCPHGPSEISEQGKWACLVRPGDAGSLADALVNFAASPASLRNAARSARPSLLSRFTTLPNLLPKLDGLRRQS